MSKSTTTNETPTPEVQEEVKAPEVQEEVKDEYVEVYIHKTSELDDPNEYVGLNGVNYVLPKGQTVSVPKAVANEIARSRRAQEKRDKKIDALVAEASK